MLTTLVLEAGYWKLTMNRRLAHMAVTSFRLPASSFQKTKIPLVVQGRRGLRGTTLVAGEWS